MVPTYKKGSPRVEFRVVEIKIFYLCFSVFQPFLEIKSGIYISSQSCPPPPFVFIKLSKGLERTVAMPTQRTFVIAKAQPRMQARVQGSRACCHVCFRFLGVSILRTLRHAVKSLRPEPLKRPLGPDGYVTCAVCNPRATGGAARARDPKSPAAVPGAF